MKRFSGILFALVLVFSLAAIAALVKECTIEIEKVEETDESKN